MLSFLLTVVCGLLANSQNINNYIWRVQLTDKKNSKYSLNNPSEFLSSKAIHRRLIQNIKIDYDDLPINQSYIDSISQTGIRIINKSKWLNSVIIDNVDSISLSKIKALPFVSKVETVYKYSLKNNSDIKLDYALNKENITSGLSYLKSDFYKYGYSFDQVHMIECDSLHKMGFRGKGITIALLDAGFSLVDKLPIFDSIRLNNRIIGTKDFVNIYGNVYEQDSHGMKVLSTLAGNIPNVYLGTAPDANYWLFRTEDSNSEFIIEEDNWVSATEYADSVGVDIINSSLGYSIFEDSTENVNIKDLNGKTARISIAATIAAKKGIIVVCSAGNQGTDASWNYLITVPADADSILTVGAVDINKHHADLSSRGPTYDGRLKPDVVALGYGTAVASLSGDIESGNGTSFSSPIVAGMVACLWQSKPSMSNMKIIDAIQKSCNHFTKPDIFTGYGIPNAIKACSLLSEIPPQTPIDFVNSISVSPNPFSNEINITMIQSQYSDIRFDIFDIKGIIVYSHLIEIKNNGYRFVKLNTFENLPNGIYFLKILTKEKKYFNKLIKIE